MTRRLRLVSLDSLTAEDLVEGVALLDFVADHWRGLRSGSTLYDHFAGFAAALRLEAAAREAGQPELPRVVAVDLDAVDDDELLDAANRLEASVEAVEDLALKRVLITVELPLLDELERREKLLVTGTAAPGAWN